MPPRCRLAAIASSAPDGYLVPAEFATRSGSGPRSRDNLIDRIDAEPTTSNAVNDTDR